MEGKDSVPVVEGLADLVEIGRGGFGVVYRAQQVALRRPVAAKVFSLTGNESRRVEREASALGALTGIPHVVPVHQVTHTADGRPVIVMALMDRSMSDALRGGDIDLPTAMTWLDQVAGALDAAHARGIHHRDVKPENVLLDHTGAHLADFGIAGLVEMTASTTTSFSFSPPYAPPERLTGQTEQPAAGDVYSLAATFYEVLAGVPPFGTSAEGGLHGLTTRVVSSPLPRPGAMPPAVHAVLANGMAKDPAGRTASAGELARQLRTACAPTTIAASATGSTTIASATSAGRATPLHDAATVAAGAPARVGATAFAGAVPSGTATVASPGAGPISPTGAGSNRGRRRWLAAAVGAVAAAGLVAAAWGLGRESRWSEAAPTTAAKATTTTTTTSAAPTTTLPPTTLAPTTTTTATPSRAAADIVELPAAPGQEAPQIPAAVEGYRKDRAVVSDVQRIFSDSLGTIDSLVAGSNACAPAYWTLRWRSMNPDVKVLAAVTKTGLITDPTPDGETNPDANTDGRTPALAGYLAGYACDTPIFDVGTVIPGSGLTLVDVVYEYQLWVPGV